MDLTIFGEYHEVRFALIEKADAKTIIANGIEEDDIDELLADYDDITGGLINGEVFCNDSSVLKFTCENREAADYGSLGENRKWCFLRSETGRWEGKLKIKGKFSADKFSVHIYENNLNGFKVQYLAPFYDGEEIEFDGNKTWSEGKTSYDHLCDPSGVEHKFQVISSNEEDDDC
jgi:hypothetical protein